MTKTPLINAVSAITYIVIVVVIMTVITQPLKNKPDTFFAPIVVLSVLTLSVAVMAYLFFYHPLILFIENKKTDAIQFFIRTVAFFSIFTALALFLLFCLGI
jgi:predicted membrane channel-forming protein YqfA (hemolysin III family)